MFQLEKMKISRLSFIMEAGQRATLPPFLGSTLRGTFGYALKEVGCPSRCEEPKSCEQPRSCAYAYCFETPIPPNAARMKRQQHAPHPLWFEVDRHSQREWQVHDQLLASLVMVGHAVDLYPYIILALDEMGKRGFGHQRKTFRLLEIWDSFAPEEQGPLWSGSLLREPRILQAHQMVQEAFAPTSVTIELMTPMRILEQKKLLRRISFRSFIRSLLSRFTSLQYFHCDTEVELDFRGLLHQAESVQCTHDGLSLRQLERTSNRQQRAGVPLDGMEGSITWQGDAVATWWPLLQIGQLLHTGKSAIMGLGQYRITDAF